MTAPKQILDACAMMAFIRRELGGLIVEAMLKDPDQECYAHSINLREVFYKVSRESGEEMAEAAIQTFRDLGLIERSDMAAPFWREVARLKSRGGISIADCFCLALAIELGGQVATSDRREFGPLVPLGLCPILFIR